MGSEGDCDVGPLSNPSLGPFQSPLLCRQKDGNQSPDFGFPFFLFFYAISRMETLDKALALCSSRCGLPRSMWPRFFYWSEIIASVERSLSDSVFWPVGQASPTFPEVCFHPGWDSLFPQTSMWPFFSALGFFLSSWSQSSAVSEHGKFLQVRFRRSFVFAFLTPSAGSTLKGLSLLVWFGFQIYEFKSVRLPRYSVVFLEFNWIWDLSPRASPFGFGFQVCGSVSTYVKCPYGDTSTPRVFGGIFQFCGPESPIGKASLKNFLCIWSAILHMLAGFDSFEFMGFEKVFEALSRSQVLASMIPFLLFDRLGTCSRTSQIQVGVEW